MNCPEYVKCLEIYVTNQCNMRCTNCCVDLAKEASDVVSLKWRDLKPALDEFMDSKIVPFGGQKFLAFAGGEPFVVYPLLLKAIKHLARFPIKPLSFIYTNGSLVRPEWLEELTSRNAMVIFSLDGDRQANDRYRRFGKKSARSAWDAVMKIIKNVPKNGLGTNSVLRPGNLEGLIEAFDEFSRMGFSSVDFWIDYLHEWTPLELRELERFMRDFADYYVGRTLKEGKIPFYTPMLHHSLINAGYLRRSEVWWKDCFRLILGPDGNYYDCQGMVCFPVRDVKSSIIGRPLTASGGGTSSRRSSAGRPNGGMDWAKRQAFMDKADIHLKAAGAETDWQYVCPRVYSKIAEHAGKDPSPMSANLHRVSKVFLQGFLSLAARVRDNASFRKEYTDKLAFPAHFKETSAA